MREDVLCQTYVTAIQKVLGSAEKIIDAVSEGACLAMESENAAELRKVEDSMIETQEAVLELYKQKTSKQLATAEYEERVTEYKSRMKQLEARQSELKQQSSGYAEVRTWLTAFESQMSCENDSSLLDLVLVKTLVEQIVVNPNGIRVQFKCGGSVEQNYVK